jgi:hypothetical protein
MILAPARILMSRCGMSYRSWLVAPWIALAASTGCGGSTTSNGTQPDEGGAPYNGDGGMPTPGHELTLLASLGGSTYTLQIDSTSAYVLAATGVGTDETSVLKVPLSGGAPVTLASDDEYASGLAVNGTTVYWVDSVGPPDDASTSTGVVMSVPVGGGAPTTVASNQGSPDSVAVDSTGVYWANADQCEQQTPCATVGAIMMLPPGGTTPVVVTTLSAATPEAITLDGTNVYWGTPDGRLMTVPKSGGISTMLAFYEASIGDIVVSGSSVYWTTGTGDIMQTPVGGGTSTAIMVGSDSISGLAVDSDSLYWIDYSNDFETGGSTTTVQKMALAGGPPTILWSGSDEPEALQVDATSVYFVTYTGDLFKLAPK